MQDKILTSNNEVHVLCDFFQVYFKQPSDNFDSFLDSLGFINRALFNFK